jgi:hypothetical protein
LAEASQVDLRTIQRIEAGQSVSMHTWSEVAAALGVSVDDLRSESGAKASPQPSGDFLPRILKASQLIDVVARACAFEFCYDEVKNTVEADLLGEVLGELQDVGEIWEDIAAFERVHTTLSVQQGMDTLETKGFWVFGAQLVRQIKLSGASDEATTTPWPIAAIRIVRNTNPEIIREREGDSVFESFAKRPATGS